MKGNGADTERLGDTMEKMEVASKRLEACKKSFWIMARRSRSTIRGSTDRVVV